MKSFKYIYLFITSSTFFLVLFQTILIIILVIFVLAWTGLYLKSLLNLGNAVQDYEEAMNKLVYVKKEEQVSKYCTNCGAEIKEENGTKCEYCGSQIVMIDSNWVMSEKRLLRQIKKY